MKIILTLLMGLALSGCSSGNGKSSAENNVGQGNSDCTILTNQIQLSSGESCRISTESASEYSLSSGDISCDSGVLTWGGSEFGSKEDGVVFNGLTVFCSGSIVSYACDGKEVCSEMTSCSEATYYLLNCPNVRIDGNNDGVPCEQQWCN